MRIDQIIDFDSVKEFLACNQNVIRFADYIRAEDLLNTIVDLIISVNILILILFGLTLKWSSQSINPTAISPCNENIFLVCIVPFVIICYRYEAQKSI